MVNPVNLAGYATVLSGFEELADQFSGEVTYVVGTNVEYSVFVEFGTRHMQARPYLRPAVREAMNKADNLADKADSSEELVKLIALEIERSATGKAPVDTGKLQASIEAERVQ